MKNDEKYQSDSGIPRDSGTSCSQSDEVRYGQVADHASRIRNISIFRLDALALSVIATATWLAGWLGGWLSHSSIVSKPLNLSENFFDHLKAASL